MTKPLMVILTGAYGNLGDAVIRRRIFEWVRDAGNIHAYVGNATDDWIEELGLAAEHTTYRANQVRTWMKLFVARTPPRGLIFDPGEVPLGKREFRPELIFLVLTLITRLRGGIVVRPPRGVGEYHPLTGLVHKCASSISNVTLWRNKRSLDVIKVGTASPDTAFQEPFTGADQVVPRSRLIVSMRGKRDHPSQNWVDAVKALATANGLEILVLSQVREDEARTKELSEILEGSYFAWGESSDIAHEYAVRDAYREARFVISDRLHVLILSALAGAVPLELADSPKGKAEAHFSQIEISNVVFDSAKRDASDFVDFAEQAEHLMPAHKAKMDEARRALSSFESQVRRLLEASK